MRSDDRDFVDDMLDDVSGGMSSVGIGAGGSLAAPASIVQQLAKTMAPASGGGAAVVNVAGTPSGSVKSTGGAPLTTADVQRLYPQLAGSLANMGVRIATPGSSPSVETPPVSVTAIPGEEGQAVGGLAGAIASVTDPRLRQVIGGIRAMRLQAQATSEHAALAAQTQFRRDVTARLARIESRLPAGSLRSQVSTVRARILPLLLG